MTKETPQHLDCSKRFRKLLTHCKLIDFTQKEIANRLDISPIIVSRLITGNQGMSSETALKIKEKLGASYEWLRYGSGAMMEEIEIGRVPANYYKLNDGDRRTVSSLIQFLLNEVTKEQA